MSTHIQWTDETWNPVSGCTRVSPGCDHCYIDRTPPFRMAHRRFDGPGTGATTGVTLHPERLYQPLKWRKPRRVFVNSLSDLFHEDIPDGYIARVWDVMAQCPQHTFQILTKRHARMRSWVRRWADTTGDGEVTSPGGSSLPPMPRGPEAVRATYTSGRARVFADMLDSMGQPPEGCAYPLYDWMEGQRWWPAVLPNVWLGVTVENQQWAKTRIPALLDTPAAVRFLSCEPLLGPVDLERPLPHDCSAHRNGEVCPAWYSQLLDWVIVGGESGPDARPMHPQWARQLRDQCQNSGVPVFFKQWGEWSPDGPVDGRLCIVADDGTTYQRGDLDYPDGPRYGEALRAGHDRAHLTAMYRVGKTRAGRELDGCTWDEYPTTSVVRS